MNKEKGDKYEIYIHKLLNNINIAYLWYDIPEKDLIESDLIHDLNKHRLKRKKFIQNPKENTNPLLDIGIDILEIKDNEYIFVQCKNGYNKGIRIEDLAGFFFRMANHPDKLGKVFYTSKLSIHIRENAVAKNIQYIKEELKDDIIEVKNKKIQLYDYQTKAINELNKWFETKKRGILNLPCGTGKTLTGCYFANNYDNVIILSPLRQFAEQNITRFKEYNKDYETVLVDSDGIRDIKEIKQIIKKNKHKKLLFSSTFRSVDIVNQFVKLLDNCIVIIDEFHNLSKSNVTDENDEFYKLLKSNIKILFQSATPRVYELEDDNDECDDDIFGGIASKMDFKEAIEKKYICDYKIYLPSISENKKNLIKLVNKEIGINDIDDSIKAKCMFLMKCMLYHGRKKCIVYCKDINETDLFKKALKKLDEFYAIELNVNTITSEDSQKKRDLKLQKFNDSDKPAILLSVQILDECIDIPKCDCIYITYSSKSKIRTIQRMCRCLRKDKDNVNKIGYVYIWCDEYDEILETLSGIKEYDIDFKEKICLETIVLGDRKKMIVDDIDVGKVKDYLMDVREYNVVGWMEMYGKVVEFMEKYERKPLERANNKNEKTLGIWILTQQQNYKNKRGNVCNIKENKAKWEDLNIKYYELLRSKNDTWNDNYNELLNFFEENKRRPLRLSKNEKEKYLEKWMNEQHHNYNNDIKAMKDSKRKKMWKKLIKEYNIYFKTKDDIWNDNYNKIISFISNNYKLPDRNANNKDEKMLACWFDHQRSAYNKKNRLMKDSDKREKWDILIKKIKKYLTTGDEIWYDKYNEVIEFIKKYNKRPTGYKHAHHTEEEQILGRWFDRQQLAYKKENKSMSDPEKRKKWKYLIDNYLNNNKNKTIECIPKKKN